MLDVKPCVFRFSDIEVREAERRVTRAGKPIALEPKTYRLLLHFLHSPGHLVTKNELLDAVWGDTAVTESSLTRAMALLRRALDDNPREPHYIATISTAGYRFICPVETIEDSNSNTGNNGSGSGAGRTHSAFKGIYGVGNVPPKWRITGAATLVLIALCATLLGLNVAGVRDTLLAAILPSSGARLPVVKALAVLPFEDLSADPKEEYLADGMTAELITNLASMSGLRVISRTSVMRFKGARKPLAEIARELNVDGIVEATVARSGNHLHFTVDLLYAPTDRHIWANSYETEMEDVLLAQSKMARSIGDALRIELAPSNSTSLSHTRRVNPDAYDAYLQGRYFTNQWNEGELEKAATSFRRSIDLDPGYAPAYDGLADIYWLMASFGRQPVSEAQPLAKAAAQKALELDDGLADAHSTAGMIKLMFDWDWAGAEKELKRAVQLAPNSSVAHSNYGIFLLTVRGRRDEALDEARKALDLDPLTPSANAQLAWVLYYGRRHDESIAQLKRALQLDPSFVSAYMELGWNYAQKGMYSEASLACQKALDLQPEEQVVLSTCGNVYGLAGRREEAFRLLTRLRNYSQRRYVDPYYFAFFYF